MITGLLSSCAPYDVYETVMEKNKIVVPVSSFAGKDIKIIRAKNLDYDIALRKMKDGSFTALLLRCTHASNPLKYTGSEFFCSLHGSTFDLKGIVIEGPAVHSLRKYETVVTGNNIVIIID